MIFIKNLKLKNNSNSAFTLIEMIVSIAIFTVVALIAVGAFLKIIDLNNKSHTLKDSINNLNYVMDVMTRELRVGSNYYCPTSPFYLYFNTVLPPSECPDGQRDTWSIYFYSPDTAIRESDGTKCRLVHAYRYTNGFIEKAEQKACEDEIIYDVVNPPDFVPIVSTDNIVFSKATMEVIRNATNPFAVPFVQFHFAQ